MQSINFEFLRPRWTELAALGGFAEAYAHGDPIGALVKLRAYCEQMVAYLYHHHRLPKTYRATLIDLLDSDHSRRPFRGSSSPSSMRSALTATAPHMATRATR
jgi:hypothetical protein